MLRDRPGVRRGTAPPEANGRFRTRRRAAALDRAGHEAGAAAPVEAPPLGLSILIPSRNRPQLALEALESALRERPAGATIVLSDNSNDADAARWLRQRVAALEAPRVRHVVPPRPLGMTAHWEWAVGEVLADSAVTHVAMLTDRMLYKSGRPELAVATAAANPDDVVSFNHDRLADHRPPVRLELAEWSGRVYRVPSVRLIELGSRAQTHPALPRMLNCLVPRAVFERLGARFGSVFASIAPDHVFAYRILATHGSILYLDRAVLVDRALARSNGSSYARGVPSPDSADFMAELGSTRMNSLAPEPRFHTVMNAVANEFEHVRREIPPGTFPPLDRASYLDAMESGIRDIEDSRLAQEQRALLAAYRRPSAWRTTQRRASHLARLAAAHPVRFWWRLAERLAGAAEAGAAHQYLTLEEGVRHALVTDRRTNRRGTHLLALLSERTLAAGRLPGEPVAGSSATSPARRSDRA